jgi:hypothetical protein
VRTRQGPLTNEDVTILEHGDMAVANYRSLVKVTRPNVNVHRRFRTTNVWAKRNGR